GATAMRRGRASAFGRAYSVIAKVFGPILANLNSVIFPVSGSKRPSLFAIWPVYQSEPSGATAGSCGRDLGVGTSNSLMDAFGAAAIRAVTVRQINEQNSKVFVRMADRFHNGFLGPWMAVQ